MFVGNVFQQSYNIVDSVIVGRLVGKSALAAVGASFPVVFLFVSLVMGATVGFSIVISQFFGAKDTIRVRGAIDTAYTFLFFAGLLMSLSGFFLSPHILAFLNTPSEIFTQALSYMRIIMFGFVFMFGYTCISAVLRGLGDSMTPLYFLVFSNCLNALLVIVFVKYLGWGVAGSAWGTVISQAVAFLLLAGYLARTNRLVRVRFFCSGFDWEILRKSLKIGLPSGVQQMMVAGGMMAVARMVNNFGTDTVAAYSAAGRADSFALMPAMSLSTAVSTFVGQNLGAGRIDRVEKGLKTSLAISAAISLLVTVIVTSMGHRIISLFNSDPAVISIGTRYLVIVGGFYLLFSWMFVINGLLRGVGDAIIPMIVVVLSLWIVRVPVSDLLSSRIGSDGIWWGIPLSWAFGLAASSGYYLTGKWKRKVVPYLSIPQSEREPQRERV